MNRMCDYSVSCMQCCSRPVVSLNILKEIHVLTCVIGLVCFGHDRDVKVFMKLMFGTWVLL